MATKPASKTTSSKSTSKTTSKKSKQLTDKERVLERFSQVECRQKGEKFYIFDPVLEQPFHSGLCDSEEMAWKRAAHELE